MLQKKVVINLNGDISDLAIKFGAQREIISTQKKLYIVSLAMIYTLSSLLNLDRSIPSPISSTFPLKLEDATI